MALFGFLRWFMIVFIAIEPRYLKFSIKILSRRTQFDIYINRTSDSRYYSSTVQPLANDSRKDCRIARTVQYCSNHSSHRPAAATRRRGVYHGAATRAPLPHYSSHTVPILLNQRTHCSLPSHAPGGRRYGGEAAAEPAVATTTGPTATTDAAQGAAEGLG